MTALSKLACCRLGEDLFSFLLGNVVMDGEELRGGTGGGVRGVCQLVKKITCSMQFSLLGRGLLLGVSVSRVHCYSIMTHTRTYYFKA